LSWDHIVGATDIEQSGQEFRANICESYGHVSTPA
jgi:hypothetical protein